MNFKPGPEHAWLDQMIGHWAISATAPGCEAPPGTETVRSIGGFWIVAEGKGEMPNDGGPMTSLLTLGYDPRVGSFVGSWVGSMMPYTFFYEGVFDGSANTLTLHTEGPDFSDLSKSASYREIVTIIDQNTRTFVSQKEAEDGSWSEFMNARYTRL